MLEHLNKQIEGEVLTDKMSLMLYATDASIYQIVPKAVVLPKTRNDCQFILQYANEHGLGIIPRSGGTSLAGQVVGEHIIVDTSRFLNRIINVDLQNNTALVETGVIPANLNFHLHDSGLMFAPDPSTLDRCTIGGMIGNNAWGAHCPAYGTTADNVVAMDCLLSSGEGITFHSLSQTQLDKILSQNDTKAGIYQTVDRIITTHKKHILDHYPSIESVPSNTGYALHRLAAMQPWSKTGHDLNLSTLICGSEGSLAFINNACLKLVPRPAFQTMICAHFNDLQQALTVLPRIKAFSPGAIELLDNYLVKLVQLSNTHQKNGQWIQGQPEAILLIEFNGHEKEIVDASVNECCGLLKTNQLSYHLSVLTQEDTQQAWQIRRAALGLLMGVTNKRKPVTFIEDSAVPIDKIAEFVAEINTTLKKHNVDCVYYGSVSMGLIHLRPLLDLHERKDIDLLNIILDKTAAILKRYRGSISAKHGDGIIRGQQIQTMLGDDIISMMQDIKFAFDPKVILNPGKIIKPLNIGQQLRYLSTDTQSTQPISLTDTFFNWQQDEGFSNSLEKCNGAGACRKTTPGGTMCPSYRATGEEEDSTRGRANVFRQTYLHASGRSIQSDNSLTQVLRNCLSCKACHSECPANVDMAKMKSEHQYKMLKRNGKTAMHYLLIHFERLSKLGCIQPTLFNRVIKTVIAKNILGIHPQRQIPNIYHENLGHWYKKHRPHAHAGNVGRVIILNDPFSYYYDVETSIAAIEVLERFGIEVIMSPCFPSIRTMISHGLLDEVESRIKPVATWLSRSENARIPIIGLEPSEILTYRDEVHDLKTDAVLASQLQDIKSRAFLFEEFVSNNIDTLQTHSLQAPEKPATILVHNHCHQKSLSDVMNTKHSLSIIPNLQITELQTGCCGMAGFFGYAKDSYILSQQIAELELYPQIRANEDSVIVATGTSCRVQIKHGLNKNACSTAEVIRRYFID